VNPIVVVSIVMNEEDREPDAQECLQIPSAAISLRFTGGTVIRKVW